MRLGIDVGGTKIGGVVLVGGLSNLTSLHTVVSALIGNYVFSDHAEFSMVPPAHDDSSGVRGAAWLWPADD